MFACYCRKQKWYWSSDMNYFIDDMPKEYDQDGNIYWLMLYVLLIIYIV